MSSDRSILAFADVHRFRYTERDVRLFESSLGGFVPPGAFDVHAHLYDLRHLVDDITLDDCAGGPEIGLDTFVGSMRNWMGERTVADGLFFPFPVRGVDCDAANTFLSQSIAGAPESRGLMLIRPQDDPAAVESRCASDGFVGFKVYHLFAPRPDTFNAEIGEYLPEWAWALAHQHELVIMLHLVLPDALSDVRNQEYIVQQCRRYPLARLVLAHAARSFQASHTVDGIDALRGVDNVWFDTSAICEPAPMEAILRTFGVTRLMYGSDFPVSELRGRAVSVGDQFFWMYADNVSWGDTEPALVGWQSLAAVQQACRTMRLVDRDIEKIFSDNARQLLGIATSEPQPQQRNGEQLYESAKQIIPGGTQLLSKRPEMFAPGRWPAYFEQAVGCEVIDVEGRRYLDFSHCGILSCILGYADPDVNDAVIRRVTLGNMATQQTYDEVELAELLLQIHPWADMVRYARTGGEAMAIAVRIARAWSGKSRIIVCGYHGWHDWYLAANLQPEGEPSNSQSRSHSLDRHLLPGLRPIGTPDELAGTVESFSYNDLSALDRAIEQCGAELAAIVMEPARGDEPSDGFLPGVRQRADGLGVPLIFDEISSAWRHCLGGLHRLYQVEPDIAVFAKGLSNGFAMSAVIGRADVMRVCEESFISSTYWTEGIGPAAALAAVRKMMRVDVPSHLTRLGTMVMDGWQKLAAKHHVPITVSGRPASCSISFGHPDNNALLTLVTARMLDRGFLAGGNCSLTYAHQTHHVEQYLAALDEVFADVADAIRLGDVRARLGSPVKHTHFRRLVN